MPRRVLAGVALVLLLAACGFGPARPTLAPGPATSVPVATAPTAPPTTTRPLNITATAAVPSVAVWDAPGGQGDPSRTLANPAPPYNVPLVFLVRQQQPDWLEVLLPIRPNGSSGWIRRSDVTLASNDYRIVVELGAHQITVYEGEAVFDQEPIGVGTQDTPTPGGLYYTKELLQPVDDNGNLIPEGPYGPYAYGLSGYSDVLYDFAGGDGVIGIHGTNDPSSIGHDASHGCIRMANDGITKLAKTLPIGVPVEIKA
ncbi:MAG: L,D-transpeptidase [Acidimicrobiales bacterium]